MSDVQLTISKDVVSPIVEAKIKEAIIASLGGADQIIEGVVNQILYKKVNVDGNVSNYQSDNKYSWIDVAVTKQIKKLAEEAIKQQLADASTAIKEHIIKTLQTKKGASMAASALLAGLTKTFESAYRSTVDIKLIPLSD